MVTHSSGPLVLPGGSLRELLGNLMSRSWWMYMSCDPKTCLVWFHTLAGTRALRSLEAGHVPWFACRVSRDQNRSALDPLPSGP